VEVKVMTVTERTTDVSADIVGEVRGSVEVEVRSRVSGILMTKQFVDGAIVRKGDVLFRVDDREFRNQLAEANARVAEAETLLQKAREDVARYAPLVKTQAISRQIYENAIASENQARARVEAVRSGIAAANLSIEYAVVTAPITGRIGEALLQPGGLVAAGNTVLAKISQDNPAWVYFSVAEAQLLNFTRRYADPQAREAALARIREVSLTLADGTAYPLKGRINFGDRAIDPKTGSYTLRAQFDNPSGLLRPGLYGRITLLTDRVEKALLVPDRAVQEQLGSYFVTVIGAGEKAELRTVTLGQRTGSSVIVSSGLKAGDRVVVEGTLKARPGMTVKATAITDADLAGTAGAGPVSAPAPVR
jgi:membrane fusion protein (multidrug efflux system)